MTDPSRAPSGGPDDVPEVADSADLERKMKRRRRIELGVSVVLLVLLFGVILPQVVDHGQVWKAVTSLSADQVGILLVLASSGS